MHPIPVDHFCRKLLKVIQEGLSWPVMVQLKLGEEIINMKQKPICWDQLQRERVQIAFFNCYAGNSHSMMIEFPIRQLQKIYKQSKYNHIVIVEVPGKPVHHFRTLLQSDDIKYLELLVRKHGWWRLTILRIGRRKGPVDDTENIELHRSESIEGWIRDRTEEERNRGTRGNAKTQSEVVNEREIGRPTSTGTSQEGNSTLPIHKTNDQTTSNDMFELVTIDQINEMEDWISANS